MRELPLRAFVALLTAVLLFLSGDNVGLWPLCWVAFVPLCFACRGAGPVAALLLAVPTLAVASVLNTLWLLDATESPALPWLLAGVPALAFVAAELPIGRILPRLLRALIAGALFTGFYAMLPAGTEYLVPLGQLIDSEIVRLVYPKLGLATVAGILVFLGWMCAEWFGAAPGDVKLRARWPGLLMAGVLALLAGIDWLGVTRADHQTQQLVNVWVIPNAADAERGTLEAMGESGMRGVALWGVLENPDDATLRAHLWAAGRLAQQRELTLAVMVAWPDRTEAWLYIKSAEAAAHHVWPGGEGHPLVFEGAGILTVIAGRNAPENWSLRNDLQLLATTEQPNHEAELNWWLREQRRSALIRGTRRLLVWKGGGAAIGADGRLNAISREGKPVGGQLEGGERHGEPLGRERLRVWEKILGFSAPVLLLMLVVVSGVRWAKLRWRNRDTVMAIEEVDDGETTLTAAQKDTITRIRKKGADQ
ncbi:MAG: hypothetical protein IPK87_13960 [Planctomycetes bacterium]|nr:hypothetical protein [Planctomycetota bacterium]